MTIKEPVILNMQALRLSNEQFYQLSQVNDHWKLEQNAEGELIIMPPVDAISGNREAEFNGLLWLWNRETKLGKVFSSSTVFTLPNGARRSPDVAWIRSDRWNSLSLDEQERFAPICPDFVMELRSRTDPLNHLQAKMEEYLEAGLKLGWLIDPQNQQIEIYRSSQAKEILDLPAQLFGEQILPGFTLDVTVFS